MIHSLIPNCKTREMTAKKKVPAKRGRKPAPPGAKLSQLTIRLPPTQRLGLAMLARDKGMSVSQAVEYALAQVLRGEVVDGSNIEDHVYRWGPRDRLAANGVVGAEALAEEALHSDPLFITILPAKLRTPEEAFFVEVTRRLGVLSPDGKLGFAINGDAAEELLTACKTAFRRGVDADAVVDEWTELLLESKR